MKKNISPILEKMVSGACQMTIARKLRAGFSAAMALAFLLMSPAASAAAFTVDTSAAPSPITGLWSNQNESGWGVALTQQYDVIFVTMYAYDSAGNPVWYVASNCAVSASGCTGDFYKVTGGSLPTATWNGANIAATAVGTLTLAFTDNNTGTMNYTINGVAGTKAITRQIWRTAPPAVANYAGTWVGTYLGYPLNYAVTQTGNNLTLTLTSPIMTGSQTSTGVINGNTINVTTDTAEITGTSTLTVIDSTTIRAVQDSCTPKPGSYCLVQNGTTVTFTKK